MTLFDLVYIDADYSYGGCLQDIKAWCPKVKKGRFFVGDDYSKQGVFKAVNEIFKDLIIYELPRHGWAVIK